MGVLCRLTFPDDERYMRSNAIVLARQMARRAVEFQYQAQGLKLQNIKACEISREANAYLDRHPELIDTATERYRSFVESGLLQRQRYRRKPGQ
jgi:hypothetical protein